MARNPETYRAWVLRKKARARDVIREAKNRPCADCGIQYPYYVMHFDHVRGEKKFMMGSRKNRTLAVNKILEEIAKCDVVCANCHAFRTWRQLQERGGQW